MAGGAVLGTAGGASAEIVPDDLGASTLPVATGTLSDTLAAATGTTTSTLGYALGPAFDLQLYPLANNSGTDPLANGAGTKIADFRPVSTATLTGPLADGASLGTLPGESVERLLGAPGA